MTTLTKAALEGTGMDNKAMLKCRNIFVLGLLCWLFDRPEESARKMLREKFAKKPAVFEANSSVLRAGYDYGHNIHASVSTFRIDTDEIRPGVYTDIKGNRGNSMGPDNGIREIRTPALPRELSHNSGNRHTP